MPYNSRQYEYLFDQDSALTSLDQLSHGDVGRYRVCTITSGNVVEVEGYPIWRTRSAVARAKSNVTREAQLKQNEKNATKKFRRYVNTNFTTEDLSITLTFRGEPLDESRAWQDLKNYMARIRRYRRRHGLCELKWIAVMETTGPEGKPTRIHFHVIMSGMDRDAAEELWGKGYANTRRLQADEYGFTALSMYMTKQAVRQKWQRRWRSSRNLQPPKVTYADHKISKRQVEQMAMDFESAPATILLQKYPECSLNYCEVKWSEFASGAYIYAHMYKTEEKHEAERPRPSGAIRRRRTEGPV